MPYQKWLDVRYVLLSKRVFLFKADLTDLVMSTDVLEHGGYHFIHLGYAIRLHCRHLSDFCTSVAQLKLRSQRARERERAGVCVCVYWLPVATATAAA